MYFKNKSVKHSVLTQVHVFSHILIVSIWQVHTLVVVVYPMLRETICN